MGPVQLAPEIRRIRRDRHQLGGQDVCDRGSTVFRCSRQTIDGVPNHSRDRDVPALGFCRDLSIARSVEEDLNAALQVVHVHMLAQVRGDPTEESRVRDDAGR